MFGSLFRSVSLLLDSLQQQLTYRHRLNSCRSGLDSFSNQSIPAKVTRQTRRVVFQYFVCSTYSFDSGLRVEATKQLLSRLKPVLLGLMRCSSSMGLKRGRDRMKPMSQRMKLSSPRMQPVSRSLKHAIKYTGFTQVVTEYNLYDRCQLLASRSMGCPLPAASFKKYGLPKLSVCQ